MLRRMPPIAFASAVVALAFGRAVAQALRSIEAEPGGGGPRCRGRGPHTRSYAAAADRRLLRMLRNGRSGRRSASLSRLSDQVDKYPYDALEPGGANVIPSDDSSAPVQQQRENTGD